MTEVEIKLRITDKAAVLRRLAELGWKAAGERLLERNFVFDFRDSSLRKARRVLRVRAYGDKSVLTLKIPADVGGDHKVMEEFEVSVSDWRGMVKILEALGLVISWRYEKFRTYMASDGVDGEVSLDETPIGDFLELEGDGEWIDSMAARLGFSRADYLRDSYGALFEEYRGTNPGAGRDMVFAEEPV